MTRDAAAKLISPSYSVGGGGGGGGGGDGFKFKGVRKRKWGKWVSEIRLPKSRGRIWLGSYDTPEKAARAFDAAMYYLRGRQASGFNFPNDISVIDVDVFPANKNRPLAAPEIQAAAANYANMFTETPLAPTREYPRDNEQELLTSGVPLEERIDWSFLDSPFVGDVFDAGGLPPPETDSKWVEESGSRIGEGGSAFQRSFLWDF